MFLAMRSGYVVGRMKDVENQDRMLRPLLDHKDTMRGSNIKV
jgi:hypothetical protein